MFLPLDSGLVGRLHDHHREGLVEHFVLGLALARHGDLALLELGDLPLIGCEIRVAERLVVGLVAALALDRAFCRVGFEE